MNVIKHQKKKHPNKMEVIHLYPKNISKLVETHFLKLLLTQKLYLNS